MKTQHSLHIDFPALDNLVAFLKSNQQAQIDAVTASITAITLQLKTSSDKLQKLVDQNP